MLGRRQSFSIDTKCWRPGAVSGAENGSGEHGKFLALVLKVKVGRKQQTGT